MNKNQLTKKNLWRSKFNHLRFNDHHMESCNICKSAFYPSSRFVRFCDSCREESEVYKHAGWAIYS
jgi:hypothetical protein